jgi:methylenetetrahydrofolate--tRNA-(uracil-5-)-methyltransferase
MGSMARYISTANPDNFQPMNVNFGLFPELPEKIKGKKERNERHANRALATIQNFVKYL